MFDKLYKDLTLAKLANDIKLAKQIENEIHTNQTKIYESNKSKNINYIQYYDNKITNNNNELINSINNEKDNIELIKSINKYLINLKTIYLDQKDNIFYLKNDIDIVELNKIKENEVNTKNTSIIFNINSINSNILNTFEILKYFRVKQINHCYVTFINKNYTLNILNLATKLKDYINIINEIQIAELCLIILLTYYMYYTNNLLKNITEIINNHIVPRYNIEEINIPYFFEYYKKYLDIINNIMKIYPKDDITKEHIIFYLS